MIERIWEIYVPTIQVIWPSLLAALGAAIGGGALGVLVILRREALLALALPQIVVLGSAVGLHFGFPPLATAVAVTGGCMGLIGSGMRRESVQSLVPSLLIGAMCLSVLLVANAGNELVEVQNLFVGVDVAVDEVQAWVTLAVMSVCGLLAAALWRRWLLIAQSPQVAQLAGLRPARWQVLFLMLLGAVVVVGTSALGTIMVLSMLFLPASIVLPWVKRVPEAIIGAMVIAVLTLAGGFVISIELHCPLSHSVGGCGFAILILSLAAAAASHRPSQITRRSY